MCEIASYIRESAMTFLLREYRTINIFAVAMFIVLIFAVNIQTAILVLFRSSFSLAAASLVCTQPPPVSVCRLH